MSELLSQRVKWSAEDGVARVSLVRGSGNALDQATAEALGEAASRIERSAAAGSVRVAVISAEGSTFSVGGDLREFANAEHRGRHVAAVADELHRAILTISQAPLPVVSIINGTVAGGGLGLALAADIVLMAEEAHMRLAYTAVGLSPDCGTTWALVRRLGSARAADLALANRVVSGKTAADWGLISRAVPAADLGQTVEELISQLKAGPTEAYAQTKRLLRMAACRDLQTQLDDEAATIERLVMSAHGVEGLDAFLAKRPAVFT